MGINLMHESEIITCNRCGCKEFTEETIGSYFLTKDKTQIENSQRKIRLKCLKCGDYSKYTLGVNQNVFIQDCR